MRRLVAMLVGLAMMSSGAAADAYPERVVKLLVPFPAGGSYDVIARLVANGLSEKWGRQVIVENKGGAAGEIGAAAVATAAPDGYTLLLWGDGLLINQATVKQRAFDPLTSFVPVSLVARSPQLLVAGRGVKAKSLAELIKLAKESGADLRYGTAGLGTPGHLAAELLAAKSGGALRHVPYRGGAPALTDLLSGQIELVSTGLPALLSNVQAGTVTAIAVSSEKRSTLLPDVPAMNEVVPGVFVDTWYGLLGPKGLPPAIAEKVHADVTAIMSSPQLAKRLADQGFEPVGAGPAELKAVMERDLPRWQEIVAIAGLKDSAQ